MDVSVDAVGDSSVVSSCSFSLIGLQATAVTNTKPISKQDQLVLCINNPPGLSSHVRSNFGVLRRAGGACLMPRGCVAASNPEAANRQKHGKPGGENKPARQDDTCLLPGLLGRHSPIVADDNQDIVVAVGVCAAADVERWNMHELGEVAAGVGV